MYSHRSLKFANLKNLRLPFFIEKLYLTLLSKGVSGSRFFGVESLAKKVLQHSQTYVIKVQNQSKLSQVNQQYLRIYFN